jgi:hypothetical protein
LNGGGRPSRSEARPLHRHRDVMAFGGRSEKREKTAKEAGFYSPLAIGANRGRSIETLNPAEQHKNNNDDQNNSDDADAAVSIAVTVAAKAAAEAAKQKNEEDDNENDSQGRHDLISVVFIL